jgi:hypothetical protein
MRKANEFCYDSSIHVIGKESGTWKFFNKDVSSHMVANVATTSSKRKLWLLQNT